MERAADGATDTSKEGTRRRNCSLGCIYRRRRTCSSSSAVHKNFPNSHKENKLPEELGEISNDDVFSMAQLWPTQANEVVVCIGDAIRLGSWIIRGTQLPFAGGERKRSLATVFFLLPVATQFLMETF